VGVVSLYERRISLLENWLYASFLTSNKNIDSSRRYFVVFAFVHAKPDPESGTYHAVLNAGAFHLVFSLGSVCVFKNHVVYFLLR
jgi:hypothetical protein